MPDLQAKLALPNTRKLIATHLTKLKNNPTQEQIEGARIIVALIGEPVLRRKMTQLIEDIDKN